MMLFRDGVGWGKHEGRGGGCGSGLGEVLSRTRGQHRFVSQALPATAATGSADAVFAVVAAAAAVQAAMRVEAFDTCACCSRCCTRSGAAFKNAASRPGRECHVVRQIRRATSQLSA